MTANRDRRTYEQLFCRIFSEDPVFCERIFQKKLRQVFDVREGTEIVSFLYAIPFFAKVNNQLCRAIYVYGVGTVPEARGKGYMKETFRKMEEYYGDSIDFYYLVPASESLFSLYETIGYRTGFYLKKEMLFPEKNPCLSYEIKESAETFHQDYLSYVEGFDTAILRSAEDNAFLLEDGHYHKIGDSGFFWIKEGDTAHIREAFLKDSVHLECFLDFLAQKGMQKAILTTPKKQTPYAMVKPVNPALSDADFSNGYTNLNFD